jgi:hypothetical protein
VTAPGRRWSLEPIAEGVEFVTAADVDSLQRVADALRGRGFEAQVTDDAATARSLVIEVIPAGSAV